VSAGAAEPRRASEQHAGLQLFEVRLGAVDWDGVHVAVHRRGDVQACCVHLAQGIHTVVHHGKVPRRLSAVQPGGVVGCGILQRRGNRLGVVVQHAAVASAKNAHTPPPSEGASDTYVWAELPSAAAVAQMHREARAERGNRDSRSRQFARISHVALAAKR